MGATLCARRRTSDLAGPAVIFYVLPLGPDAAGDVTTDCDARADHGKAELSPSGRIVTPEWILQAWAEEEEREKQQLWQQ
jgi:hypothetical protein